MTSTFLESLRTLNPEFHSKLDLYVDHATLLSDLVLVPILQFILLNLPNTPNLSLPTIESEYPVWAIAMCIAVGSAIFSTGVDTTVKRWFGNSWVNRRFLMLTEFTSATSGFIIGAMVGSQIWNPILGGVCGLIGGASSPFFVKKINSLFSMWSSRRTRGK